MEGNNEIAKGTLILVVAAQEDVREILQEAIIMAGYQCIIAANGSEALDRLSKNHIDLVITDIKMPLMDGLEFWEAGNSLQSGFWDPGEISFSCLSCL